MKVLVCVSEKDKALPKMMGGAINEAEFAEMARPLAVTDSVPSAIDIAAEMMDGGPVPISDSVYGVIAVAFDASNRGEPEDIKYDIAYCMPTSVAKKQLDKHRDGTPVRRGKFGGPASGCGHGRPLSHGVGKR